MTAFVFAAPTAQSRAEHDRALYGAGLEAFAGGAYYESHAFWEDLWLRNRSEARPFLQGLIQAGAALYHLEGGRRRPAVALLAAAEARLSAFAPAMLGLEVTPLLLALAACRRHAEGHPLAVSGRLPDALRPVLRYELPSQEAFAPHAGSVPGPVAKQDWLWERRGPEPG